MVVPYSRDTPTTSSDNSKWVYVINRSVATGLSSPTPGASEAVNAIPAIGSAPAECEFGRLAEEWRRDTAFMSSVKSMAMHPAYQAIIGLGKPAVPLLLRELKERPDHWFWALNAICPGEDPVRPGDDFDAAVRAWLGWGKAHGYIG